MSAIDTEVSGCGGLLVAEGAREELAELFDFSEVEVDLDFAFVEEGGEGFTDGVARAANYGSASFAGDEGAFEEALGVEDEIVRFAAEVVFEVAPFAGGMRTEAMFASAAARRR